eukprot:scaffold52_cov246-Pinguiococcus_pyrenoidosus.AAC.1
MNIGTTNTLLRNSDVITPGSEATLPIRRIEGCVCRTVQRETNPPVEVALCWTGTFLEKLHALLVRTSQSGPRLRLTHLVTDLERKT